jgi:hypothetical protein
MGQTRTINMLDRPPKAEQKPPVLTLTSAPVVAPTVNAADAYPIDTDIPIPGRPGKQGRVAQFPWTRLEIGHSFFVPGERAYKTGNFWCKWAMREWPTKRFIYRKMEGGVRIWRVEAAKK